MYHASRKKGKWVIIVKKLRYKLPYFPPGMYVPYINKEGEGGDRKELRNKLPYFPPGMDVPYINKEGEGGDRKELRNKLPYFPPGMDVPYTSIKKGKGVLIVKNCGINYHIFRQAWMCMHQERHLMIQTFEENTVH
jgi:hypothetical protein